MITNVSQFPLCNYRAVPSGCKRDKRSENTEFSCTVLHLINLLIYTLKYHKLISKVQTWIMLPQIINFSVSLTLTKVWGNFNIAHCCFPIFELRVWHSPPFSSITFSAFNFPLQVEIEMNCRKNMPENKNGQYFQKRGYTD